MTLAVDGNSKIHIDKRTHTRSGVRSPISGMISPNISLKCSLSVACVYLTVARADLWSMNV